MMKACNRILGAALLAASGFAALSAQTPEGESLTWLAPLQKASDLLVARYAKAVTYEDPVWLWRGELTVVGRDANERNGLRLRTHTFVMPQGIERPKTPELTPEVLNKVVGAYNAQNPLRSHFKVLSSKYGLHIVPADVRDEGGAPRPGTSLLDVLISVAAGNRTAEEHAKEICNAVTAASGINLESFAPYLNQYFAANGYVPGKFDADDADPRMRFVWGAQRMTARDALIDLLDRGATTYRWILTCQPQANPKDGSCVLNLGPLEVEGTYGVAPLAFDRCPNCRPGQAAK